jgi:hypothetical protein
MLTITPPIRLSPKKNFFKINQNSIIRFNLSVTEQYDNRKDKLNKKITLRADFP